MSLKETFTKIGNWLRATLAEESLYDPYGPAQERITPIQPDVTPGPASGSRPNKGVATAMPMSSMVCDSCNGRQFTPKEKNTWECDHCGALYMDEREHAKEVVIDRIVTQPSPMYYGMGSSVAYMPSASYIAYPW